MKYNNKPISFEEAANLYIHSDENIDFQYVSKLEKAEFLEFLDNFVEEILFN